MINLNRGVSTPVAITTIIVSAIVLVGGVLAYQYYYFPETEIETPEIKAPETGINNWEVYNNPKADFIFEYPYDWEVKEEYERKSASCQMNPGCKGVWYVFLNRIDDLRPANTGEKDKYGIVINLSQCTGVQHNNLAGNNWICLFDENPEVLDIYEGIKDSFQLVN
jgi:hypothetical protein